MQQVMQPPQHHQPPQLPHWHQQHPQPQPEAHQTLLLLVVLILQLPGVQLVMLQVLLQLWLHLALQPLLLVLSQRVLVPQVVQKCCRC